MSGQFATSSPLYNLTFDGVGSKSVADMFTVATDTSETYIYSMAVDSANGVLYAGSGNSGIIYRCALSTGCDSSGDFTEAYDSPALYIYSLTIDSVNGVLYAGSGSKRHYLSL
ncbi:MAG: hypothetical protein R3B53_01935 [Candidatus Paceibacterota bacterium]